MQKNCKFLIKIIFVNYKFCVECCKFLKIIDVVVFASCLKKIFAIILYATIFNYLMYRSQGSLAKLEGDSADSDTQLTKLDVVLTFQLEVIYQ